MTRAPLPNDYVQVAALVGLTRVSREQAARNRARGVHPMRPRDARAGLVPFDAAGLWEAIKRGEFPAPAIGPWGTAWRFDDVRHWRRWQTNAGCMK